MKRNLRRRWRMLLAGGTFFVVFFASKKRAHKNAVHLFTTTTIRNDVSSERHIRTQVNGDGDDAPRISFRLHNPDKVPYTNRFNQYYRCNPGPLYYHRKHLYDRTTDGLPPSLLRSDCDVDGCGRVLNFTVTVSTDLRVVFLGDSVLVQMAQAFDESVFHDSDDSPQPPTVAKTNATNIGSSVRRIVNTVGKTSKRNGHDGLTILSPTRGGGASATWRLTALWTERARNHPPANAPGGGWNFENDVLPLLDPQHLPPPLPPPFGGGHGYDAAVLRVPHGWMKASEITRDRVVEAVQMTNVYLGVETVIIMTVPFSNNVLTVEDWDAVGKINDMIRDVARTWNPTATDTKEGEGNGRGVQRVLVQEFGNLINHVNWVNARHLGYNVSFPLRYGRRSDWMDAEGPTFLYHRLDEKSKHPPCVAMLCAQKDGRGDKMPNCMRNVLSMDGMHPCMETLGSRIVASVACLLGCAHNGGIGGKTNVNDTSERGDGSILLRRCERECNEQFLSIASMDEAWIGGNASLVASSTVMAAT